MQIISRPMPSLVWVALLLAGCHPTTTRPDADDTRPAATEERPATDAAPKHAGGCVDFVTTVDGSIECTKWLVDLGAGWNCCSAANNECTQGANTRHRKNPDGSTTLVVHCGQGYYPVFCQDSKIGLICTTTEQLP